MKTIENEDAQRLLIEFSALSAPARQAFLVAMNELLFASPQRRRVIVNAWKQQESMATATLPSAETSGAEPVG